MTRRAMSAGPCFTGSATINADDSVVSYTLKCAIGLSVGWSDIMPATGASSITLNHSPVFLAKCQRLTRRALFLPGPATRSLCRST